MKLVSALENFHFEDQTKKCEKLDIVDADRIAIYLELIDSYQQLGQLAEVDAVMEEVHKRWAGKTEQQQFILMEANLKLQRKDINGALEVLESVPPTEANYQAARIKMAEIYLNEKKDKQKFAVCFKYVALPLLQVGENKKFETVPQSPLFQEIFNRKLS